MDYSNIIQPNRLTNMQEMQVNVDGPDGANRLFMYSGMAEVELCGGLPHPRWSLEIVCFDIGRTYDCDNGEDVIKVLANASLGEDARTAWRVLPAGRSSAPPVNWTRMTVESA